MSSWVKKVQTTTETYLTWRKRRKLRKQEKQKQKNLAIEWIEAFLWAALVVLLINQYLFQAYVIPSGSMRNTLIEKDRIFVNKLIYGPELVPGAVKVQGLRTPKQAEVIIFENPTYISKGVVFDIFQRVIYMVTLSLVDIDKDKHGEPRPHFLIKRAIGVGGDRLRFVKGEVQFKLPDTGEWVPERSLKRLNAPDYHIRRLVNEDEYKSIKNAGYGDAFDSGRLPLTEEMSAASTDQGYRISDAYAWNKYRNEALYSIYPNDPRYGSEWRKAEIGWYIPKGWIFPLGDNRDNSRDARYFGPVEEKKVLGKAMFIYWPLGRAGGIH